VVEWDGLENRCTGNRTVGSNPTLSAKLLLAAQSFGTVPPGDKKSASISRAKAFANRLQTGSFAIVLGHGRCCPNQETLPLAPIFQMVKEIE
jgi:hypothetical protein